MKTKDDILKIVFGIDKYMHKGPVPHGKFDVYAEEEWNADYNYWLGFRNALVWAFDLTIEDVVSKHVTYPVAKLMEQIDEDLHESPLEACLRDDDDDE